MVERISFKSYCGECFCPFDVYEITYYLPIDNDSYCNKCKGILESRTSCTWIVNLFLGRYAEDARKNLIKLIRLFNESIEDELWIESINIKEC